MAIVRAKPDIGVAVFTRAPTPGTTKTRLIPRLGAQGAADLHARLIRHALAAARESATGCVTLWRAPAAPDPFLAECAREFGADQRPQTKGDLGARMHACFEAGTPLLLMGTDAPMIDAALLRACADALAGGADAVFLPAEDGGYALVGLREPAPDLFDGMVWSVDTVMEETRRRLRALGLRWREPAVVWDVDRPADVDRLIASGLLADWTPERT